MAGVVGKNRAAFGRARGLQGPEICAMRIGGRRVSRRLETRTFDDLNLGEGTMSVSSATSTTANGDHALKRTINWQGAFWVASGVPALVLFSIGGIAATV